jgi:hypothetical protein
MTTGFGLSPEPVSPFSGQIYRHKKKVPMSEHQVGSIHFGPASSHPSLKAEKPQRVQAMLRGEGVSHLLEPGVLNWAASVEERTKLSMAISLKRIADHLDRDADRTDELRKEISR